MMVLSPLNSASQSNMVISQRYGFSLPLKKSYANTAIREMLGWYGLQDQGDTRTQTPSPPAQPPPQTDNSIPSISPHLPTGTEGDPRISPDPVPDGQPLVQLPESLTENKGFNEELLNGPVSPGSDHRTTNRKLIGMRYMFPPLGDHLSLLDKAQIWVTRHDYKYFVGWTEEQLQTVDPLLRPVGTITHDMYKLHMNRSEYCRNVKLKYCLESEASWAKEFREKLAKPFGKGGFSGLCQAKIAAAELWRKFSENYKSHQARYPNPKSKYSARKLAKETLGKVRVNNGKSIIRTVKTANCISLPGYHVQHQLGHQPHLIPAGDTGSQASKQLVSQETSNKKLDKDLEVCQFETKGELAGSGLNGSSQDMYSPTAMVVQSLEECVTAASPKQGNGTPENTDKNKDNRFELQATQSSTDDYSAGSGNVVSLGSQYVTISHHVVTQVETISGGTMVPSSVPSGELSQVVPQDESLMKSPEGGNKKSVLPVICEDSIKLQNTERVISSADPKIVSTISADKFSKSFSPNSVVNPGTKISPIVSVASVPPIVTVSRSSLTVTASSPQSPILASQAIHPLMVSGLVNGNTQSKSPTLNFGSYPTSQPQFSSSQGNSASNINYAEPGGMRPPNFLATTAVSSGMNLMPIPSPVKYSGPRLQHQGKSSEYRKCERGLSFLFPSLADQQLSLSEKVEITLMRHKNNYFKNWTEDQLNKVSPLVRPKMVVTADLFKEYCHRNAMKYDSNLQFAMEAEEQWAQDFRERLQKPPSMGGFSSLCEVKQEAGKLWKMYSGKYKKPHSIKSQMVLNDEGVNQKTDENEEADNPSQQRMRRQSSGGAIIQCNMVSGEDILLQSGVGITSTGEIQGEPISDSFQAAGVCSDCPSPVFNRSPSVGSIGSAASVPMSPVSLPLNGNYAPRKRKLSDSSVTSSVSLCESSSVDSWKFSKIHKSDFQVPGSEEGVKGQSCGVYTATKTDFQVPHSPCSERVDSPALSSSGKEWVAPESTGTPSPKLNIPMVSNISTASFQQDSPAFSRQCSTEHVVDQIARNMKDQYNIDILFRPLSNQLSVADHVHIWMERYRNNFFRDFSMEKLQKVAPIVQPQMPVTEEIYKHFISPDVISMLGKVERIMTNQTDLWARNFQDRIMKKANEGGFAFVEDALAEALTLWKVHYERPALQTERTGHISAVRLEHKHLTPPIQQPDVSDKNPGDGSFQCQMENQNFSQSPWLSGGYLSTPEASHCGKHSTFLQRGHSKSEEMISKDMRTTPKDYTPNIMEKHHETNTPSSHLSARRSSLSDWHSGRETGFGLPPKCHLVQDTSHDHLEGNQGAKQFVTFSHEGVANSSRANDSFNQALDLSHSGSRNLLEKLWACRDTLHRECRENPSESWHERLNPYLPLLQEKLGSHYVMPTMGVDCMLDLALCLLHQELMN